LLHRSECPVVNQGREGRRNIYAQALHDHPTGIGWVPQHPVKRLRRDRSPGRRLESLGYELASDILDGNRPPGNQVKGCAHEGGAVGVGGEVALAFVIHDADVANRRAGRPVTLLGSGLHARTGTLCSHVVVELGERRQHVLHELARWVFAYGLGNGANLHTEAPQLGPQSNVLFEVAGESVELPDQH